jgi:uroporphyrinogen III methyltransferase / synthase
VSGRRILIARAAAAREILPDQLRAAGADVRVITVYRTIRPVSAVERLRDQLTRRDLHVMTFASSSTVRNFCALFESREDLHTLTAGVTVACIGPITAQTAEEEGLPATIMAKENTIPALVDAIVHYFHHLSSTHT